MKVPAGQTIEEFIRDDVREIIVKTGRVPRLAYLVNWGDATHLLHRLKPGISDTEFHARDFELHTNGGLVRVIGDRYSPRGAVYRMIVCKCGAVALYTPGIDECLNCITLKPRPYAPGEKMTDRHPNSVIAQVAEETIAKQVKHIATLLVTTCPTWDIAIDEALAEVDRHNHVTAPPTDPLDVEYDGVALRDLVEVDAAVSRETCGAGFRRLLTPAQRAAVSAHWSAQLRAKVAASVERDRRTVMVDTDID